MSLCVLIECGLVRGGVVWQAHQHLYGKKHQTQIWKSTTRQGQILYYRRLKMSIGINASKKVPIAWNENALHCQAINSPASDGLQYRLDRPQEHLRCGMAKCRLPITWCKEFLQCRQVSVGVVDPRACSHDAHVLTKQLRRRHEKTWSHLPPSPHQFQACSDNNQNNYNSVKILHKGNCVFLSKYQWQSKWKVSSTLILQKWRKFKKAVIIRRDTNFYCNNTNN